MSETTELELPETMHIETEADAPPENRQLSPRELAMQAIAKRHQEAREAELRQSDVYDQEARAAGLGLPEDEPEPPPVAVEPVAQEPVGGTPAPATQDAPVPAPAAALTLRTVDIDGQQWAVSEEQYQQLARMGLLAQRALATYQPEPVAPEPVKPIVDPERVREAAKRIQYGNEDEAAAALTELITDVAARMPATPSIDPNAIVQRATTAAMQQAQLARDTDTIRQEYADIFENPQRTLLARMNVEAIRARNAQTGRFQPEIEIYREAGNMVRDAMGQPRPGSDVSQPALQAATVAPRTEVIERKRAAPRMTQAIDRRAPQPEMPRPPSGSEIVERMRAQRGQASMR
jgi:hypothetical protein